MLPLDDVRLVCQFFENKPYSTDRDQFVMCVNTATHEIVGTPRRIYHGYNPMVMNGCHFVLHRTSAINLYERSMDFFLDTEHVEEHQIIRTNALARV